MKMVRVAALFGFAALALLSVSAVQCGSGVGCLGDYCDEIFAEPGTSEVSFAGASHLDRVEANSLRVNWEPVADASEYLVFDVTTAASPLLVARLPATASSYTALSLLSGETYRFRVKLLDPLKRTDNNTNDLAARTITSEEALEVLGSPTSLQVWLKSTSGVVSDQSSYVSEWRDQSGNGNDFTQPDPAETNHQPVLNASGVGGLPQLSYGNQQALIGSMADLLAPHHIFIVVSGGSGGGRFLGNRDGSNGIDYGITAPNLFVRRVAAVDFGGSLEAGEYYFVTLATAGVSGGTLTISARRNGEAVSSRSIDNIAPTSENQTLVLGSDGSASFNGTMSEVLIYDSLLPDSERDRIEAYLKDRYGL